MAVQILRPEPASSDRIRRRLRPIKHAPPNRKALSAVREVVLHSSSVENAIAAVTAINAAWSKVSPATHDAIALLLTILELSDSVLEALAVFSKLVADYPAALTTLGTAKAYIASHHPEAELRIEAGDSHYQVSRSWLYVLVPAGSYQEFKAIRDRLVEWWLETFADIGGMIDITPRRKATDV